MQTTTNRRDFLRTSAATAGTLAFPAIVRGQNLNNEVRIGLVGGGGRGTGAADQNLNVTDLPSRLVAVGDVEEGNINNSLNQLKKHGTKVSIEGNKFVGLDAYQKVIEKSDLVILATPPGFRPMMFEAAVKAGKNVFMEKPICIDSPGYRQCIAAAKMADEKNLKVVVGLQRRYQTKYREAMKKVLEEKVIGEVVSAQVYWNDNRPWVRDRQPNDSEFHYQVRNWYHFTWLSGDNICEQHIHNIDIAAWALGDKLPKTARGMGGRQVLTDKKYGEIFDHHYVEYIFDKDGREVYVNSQCEHTPNTWARVSETIICTGGICQPDRGIIKDLTGKTIWRHKEDGDPNPYQVEHNELYAAIKNNTPLNNGHRAANSAMIATLGRYATYSGKEIKSEEAIGWDNSQLPTDLSKGWDTTSLVTPGADGSYTIPIPGKFDPKTNKNA